MNRIEIGYIKHNFFLKKGQNKKKKILGFSQIHGTKCIFIQIVFVSSFLVPLI
jgi:hypothetical protein